METAKSEKKKNFDHLPADDCPSCSLSNSVHLHEHKGNDEWVKLIRLISGIILFGIALFLLNGHSLRLPVYIAAYLVLGYDVLLRAFLRIRQHKLLAEHFLMSIATVGAFLIGEYPEAIAVMLFYQVGEYFQDKAVGRSRRSIAALQNIRPDKARLLGGQRVIEVSPEAVRPGDSLLILPGDRVPVDSLIVEGYSEMDTSALTGESLPRAVFADEAILAGYINGTGRLVVKASRAAADSAVSRVLAMVDSAAARKAPAERFITRFAEIYTPVVVGLAVLLAVIPPILFQQPFSVWVYRSLILLVISCPCALVLSVPLGYFAGLGSAARFGLLIKGGGYLEKIAAADTLVFDKTGTLTSGEFKVSKIETIDCWSEEKLLRIAALLEAHSTHPIARSIERAWRRMNQDDHDLQSVEQIKDIPGLGLEAVVDGLQVVLGSRRMFDEMNLKLPSRTAADKLNGSVLYMASDGQYVGRIILADQIKPEAEASLAALRKLGLRHFVMISGDHNLVVQDIARQLKIEQAIGEVMPEQKVVLFESLLKQNRKGIVYLGDGVNDAPVLARADVGIAMGSGSDAAIESADAVLMSGRLDQLPRVFSIARKTAAIVRQNVFMSLGFKLLIMVMAVFGLGGIWQAIFADVGVSLLAVFNALRLIRKPQ